MVFDRPQGVFKFALAAAISAVVSPVFGVTSLALEALPTGRLRRDLGYLVARRCNGRPHFHSGWFFFGALGGN
jgi:hypothetical protein